MPSAKGPNLNIAARAAAFSFLAVPVCYALAFVEHLYHSHILLFVVSVAILIGLGFLAHYVVFDRVKQSLYLYLLTVMSFTTIVDLVLALTIDRYVETLNFYLAQGELYLLSAYGSLINWWDCTVHFSLYVYIIACLANKDWTAAKPAVLYYVGSIINSLLVFLPGNVTGPFGDDLKASYILNAPFCIVPLTLLYHTYVNSTTSTTTTTTTTPPSSPRRGRSPASSSITRVRSYPPPPPPPPPGDGLLRTSLLLGCFASLVICTWRVIAAIAQNDLPIVDIWTSIEPFIKDPSTYPQWQALVFYFYYSPYLLFASYALIFYSNPPSWLLDISIIAAGAAAQGEWSMFGSSLHWRSPVSSRVSDTFIVRVALLNVLFAALPHSIAYYAHSKSSSSKPKSK